MSRDIRVWPQGPIPEPSAPIYARTIWHVLAAAFDEFGEAALRQGPALELYDDVIQRILDRAEGAGVVPPAPQLRAEVMRMQKARTNPFELETRLVIFADQVRNPAAWGLAEDPVTRAIAAQRILRGHVQALRRSGQVLSPERMPTPPAS